MIGAVDIGGTKVAVGVVDENGHVHSKTETPTGASSNYAEGIASIIRMLRQSAQSAGVDITGIGIGSTGPVDPFTGELGELDFPLWRHKNLTQDLAKEFGVEAALENDADAGALAEAHWGAGRGKSRLIYVTVGTGIGGGIILDGQLYRGVGGAHPEIGHHVIDPSGPACSCGFHGCWESLAAGPAMAAWFAAAQGRDDGDQRDLTAEQICQLALKHDQLAIQAVEQQTYYLGLGLANLINLFTPDMIVLGGSVMKSGPLFLEGIRSTISRGCRFVPYDRTELVLASLGDDSNLIGAARVWHHRFSTETVHAAHSR